MSLELLNPPNSVERMPLPKIESMFVPEPLQPRKPELLDTSVSLFEPNDVQSFLGFQARIPAIIQAADKQLFLVDITGIQPDATGARFVSTGKGGVRINADFFLLSPTDWDGKSFDKGLQGIRKSEPLIFGRDQPKSNGRFDLSTQEVSRSHFRLEYTDRGVTIEDLDSTNGTFVMQPDHSMSASNTFNMIERLKNDPKFRLPDKNGPYGYYDGDPLIGRKSPRISGGVYPGGGSREIITVKPDEDPRLEAVYSQMTRKNVLRKLMDKALGRQEGIDTQLQNVFDTVKSVMRYDGDAVEVFSSRFSGDKKVSLGDYIEQGIGVCRHHGLLSTYLIEKMIDDGKMAGQVKIERNTIPEYGGSHAWATYISPEGVEYVIDAAQDFVGPKQEARKRASSWDYYLPMV